MVQTLQLNATNDLQINAAGSLVMLTGVQAVAAACNTAAQTQLGECVLNTAQGLPNFQAMWVGVPDYGIWQSYLQGTLQNVPGVASVESVKLTLNNGVLNYVALITSIYGPVTISGSIPQ